jgi:hypothetical protein
MNKGGWIKELGRGALIGMAGLVVLALLFLVFRFFWERDRKIYEYIEAQSELQGIPDDSGNPPLGEFPEDAGVWERAEDTGIEFP